MNEWTLQSIWNDFFLEHDDFSDSIIFTDNFFRPKTFYKKLAMILKSQ